MKMRRNESDLQHADRLQSSSNYFPIKKRFEKLCTFHFSRVSRACLKYVNSPPKGLQARSSQSTSSNPEIRGNSLFHICDVTKYLQEAWHYLMSTAKPRLDPGFNRNSFEPQKRNSIPNAANKELHSKKIC